MILIQKQANDLVEYVEEKLTKNTCNHKLTFAIEWAKTNKKDLEDFVDLMIDNGCGCDCEVLLNLPEECDIEFEEKERKEDNYNPFKVPAIFVEDTSKLFNKALYSNEDLDYNKYTNPNELLIPAPYG